MANPIRRKRLRRAFIALIVLGLLVVGLVLALKPSKAPPAFITAPVAVADIEQTVLASGVLQALQQVNVGAQVSGQVKTLNVVLGQQVKKGDLVAEIDSLGQQNVLRDAEAAIEQIQAQKRARQAALRLATLAYARQKELFANQAGSRLDLENAEATLETTKFDIAALDAQIVKARISVDTAHLNLGYARILAPIDGTVLAIVTKQGQTLNAVQQAPTIIKLADLSTLTVKAQISEADVVKVKAGQRVYFTVLGEPDKRYSATLRTVEPAPESIANESTTSSTSSASAVYYNGLFDVPNPEGKLRLSMTAQVTIVLGEAKSALTVPATALQPVGKDGRQTVRVVGASGQPEERVVKVGLNNNVTAQILEGLKAGEKVVVAQAVPGQNASPFPGGM